MWGSAHVVSGGQDANVLLLIFVSALVGSEHVRMSDFSHLEELKLVKDGSWNDRYVLKYLFSLFLF